MPKSRLGRIMLKIKNLLALSSSDNRHEARLSRKIADKLCKKYGVTTDDVDAYIDKYSVVRYSLDLQCPTPDHREIYWRGALATESGREFGCRVGWIGQDRSHILIIGSGPDVRSATGLYRHFLKNILKNLEEYLVSSRDSIYTEVRLGPGLTVLMGSSISVDDDDTRYSFSMGAISMIRERLSGRRRTRREESRINRSATDDGEEDEVGLASDNIVTFDHPRDHDEVRDDLKNDLRESRSVDAPFARSQSAIDAGREAAREIPLDPIPENEEGQ